MILVDTGAFFALFVVEDERHQDANKWYLANQDRSLVTTDYVIDELLTLMRSRGVGPQTLRAGLLLINQRFCAMEKVQLTDFQEAWEIFSRFRDKGWSFTDCVSRVVMERLKITTAFAFDDHFRQFGTVAVVP